MNMKIVTTKLNLNNKFKLKKEGERKTIEKKQKE